MTPLFPDFVVKATILLAAAGVADVALRPRGSAAARHLVWTIAIVGLLALPIASASMPAWTVRIPVAPLTATPAASLALISNTPTPDHLLANAGQTVSLNSEEAHRNQLGKQNDDAPARTPAWLVSLIALYAAGVLLLLTRLAIEPIALRRLTRASSVQTDPEWLATLDESCRQVGLTGRVRLMRSTSEIMPLTFGTVAPAIVVPASADEWSTDRRRAVLLHELAHVVRRDCLVQRLTALTCALYWPHPGVWWAAQRLRAERELACDDRVLACGSGAREYAGHLLELAHSLGSAPAPATALGMARPKQLESRLLAVLDAARNRAAIRPGGRTIAIATAVFFLVPFASVHAALVAREAAPPIARTVADAMPDLPSQSATPPEQDLTGTWDLRLSRDPGMAQVSVHTAHGNHGRSIPLDRIPGISVEQIRAASTLVHLPIHREAGTFNIDGNCRSGVCAGTFGFEPSQPFAAELVRRGFDHPTPQQQMDLALADVGVAYLQALEKAGYAKPSLADIVRAAQHGVDSSYLEGMTALGYRAGTLEALTRLRDHGVDPSYIRGMADSGFARLTVDELLEARDHGVDPQYVKGMRDLGYRIGDIGSLVKMRDHGIDPEYVGGLASLGFRNLAIDQVLHARDHGVDPQYIRAMSELGYNGQSLDGLVKMRDHGVDPRYLRDMAEVGYKNLPVDEAIRLRDHGVDAAYVRRVQQKGLGHLSVDEIIQRRDHGMDDPDAAARAVVAQVQSLWQSVVRWMRS